MRQFLITLYIALGCHGSFAQLLDLTHLEQRIRQPDEFLDVFNDVKHHPDSLLYFARLFDEERLRNGQIQKHTFYQYWGTLKDKSASKLAFDDPLWLALLECTVIYKGKPEKLTLGLKPEFEKELGFVSWRIVGAMAGFLASGDKNIGMISPVSHNMGFLHLSKHLDEDPTNLGTMISSGHQSDDLTVLIVLFREGLISLENIDHIVFEYKDKNGFQIRLEELGKDGKTMGWGITSLNRN